MQNDTPLGKAWLEATWPNGDHLAICKDPARATSCGIRGNLEEIELCTDRVKT